MKYTAKKFSVPAVENPPESCEHGWVDRRGRCVFCGERIESRLLDAERGAA